MLTIDDPSYFDRLAEVEAAHWWSLGMWRLASSWLDVALRGRRGLHALDLGCGAGLTLARLAGRAEIATVVGLDPSPHALAWAGKRGVPLVRGGAAALPFAERSFDLVTCFDVFQHIPAGDRLGASDEIRRVLRPGGLALVRTNARGWSKVSPGNDPPYRPRELAANLRGGGLHLRRLSRANCLPAMAQEVRGRLGRSARQGPHPAGGGLQIRVPHPWVNWMLGRIGASEAAFSGRLGLPLPFGHSLLALAERSRDA